MIPDDNQDETLVRVMRIARRLPHHLKTAVATFAASALITIGAVMLATPLYRSETVLLYRQGLRSRVTQGETEPPRRMGLRLQEMLLSASRMQELITTMGLYPRLVESGRMVEAIEELRRHLTFEAREGYTFRAAFHGESPEQAQAVVARAAASLIAEHGRLRVQEADQSRKFLLGEKERVERELAAREADLARFLAVHPEFADQPATGAGAGAAILAARSAQADDPALLALELQAVQLHGQIASARTLAPVAEAPASLPQSAGGGRESAEILRAELEVVTATRELDERRRRLTDEHPDVRDARARLAEGQQRLARAASPAPARHPGSPPSPAVARTQGSGDVLGAELSLIRERIKSEKRRRASGRLAAGSARDQARIVDLETTWTSSTRAVAEARERQTQMQGKHFQAAMLASLETWAGGWELTVLDPAYRPISPAKGSRRTVAIVGWSLSFLIAALAALGRAALDDRVFGATDLGALPGVRLLAVVPRLALPTKEEMV